MATENRSTSSERGYEQPYHPANGSAGLDGESAPSLLRRLGDDFSTLVVTEVSLAKAEMREGLSQAIGALVSMAGGGIVLLSGFIVLLGAAVIGLAEVMQAWLAALIVGGVVLLIGAAMVMGGKKKLKPSALMPDRTEDQLRKDSNMIKRNLS